MAINYINIVLKYTIESDKMDNKKIVFIVSGIVFFSIVTLLTAILIKNNIKYVKNIFIYNYLIKEYTKLYKICKVIEKKYRILYN